MPIKKILLQLFNSRFKKKIIENVRRSSKGAIFFDGVEINYIQNFVKLKLRLPYLLVVIFFFAIEGEGVERVLLIDLKTYFFSSDRFLLASRGGSSM